MPRVETYSTQDSAREHHVSDGMSPADASEPAIWCVTLPCEAVLYFDNLNKFLADFGKVLSVLDIHESE